MKEKTRIIRITEISLYDIERLGGRFEKISEKLIGKNKRACEGYLNYKGKRMWASIYFDNAGEAQIIDIKDEKEMPEGANMPLVEWFLKDYVAAIENNEAGLANSMIKRKIYRLATFIIQLYSYFLLFQAFRLYQNGLSFQKVLLLVSVITGVNFLLIYIRRQIHKVS